MKSRLRTLTLGCKVNQYETELVREGCHAAGFRDAGQGEPADLCVVNTCTVTNEGDAKSRQAIRRLARDNPDANIVVMGCYATRAPQEVAQLPRVVEVVTDKRELPDVLGRFGIVDLPDGISQFGNRHRAYMKVQDGCLLRCSYCIIPHVRPRPISRSEEEIAAELERLRDNGYREMVLTGIHLGHYGVEQNWNRPRDQWVRLATLLRRLTAIPGDFRIRLSSIEATEVTRDLIAVMADHPDRICPHLHICLQSGSDRILRRMKRRWGTRRFVDVCGRIRESLDEPALTTDLIVGFPGESDGDFEDSCRLVRELGFSKVHVFPFSARRGTPAADMPDQVAPDVRQSRCRELARLAEEPRREYFQKLVGRTLRVLVESAEGGHGRGTACRYAPVTWKGAENQEGRLIEVPVVGLTADGRLQGDMATGLLRKNGDESNSAGDLGALANGPL